MSTPAPMISDTARTRAASFTARPRELFIGGRWQAAQSGETFEVIDPANERVFARAASGAEADIDVAVQAARKAFESPQWSSMTPAQRARLLLKLADLIEANGDEIALLETLDNGMPYRMAKFGGVFGAAESLRYHAGWATKMHGATINLVFRASGMPTRCASRSGSWGRSFPGISPSSWAWRRSRRRWRWAAPWCSSPPNRRR